MPYCGQAGLVAAPMSAIRDLRRDPRLLPAQRRTARNRPIIINYSRGFRLTQPSAKGLPKSAFKARHVRIGASEEVSGRPRLLHLFAYQTNLGLHQTVSEPRLRNAELSVG